MNDQTGRDVFIVTLIWSTLSQQMASTISIAGIIFAALYFLRDKIPQEERVEER